MCPAVAKRYAQSQWLGVEVWYRETTLTLVDRKLSCTGALVIPAPRELGSGGLALHTYSN